MTEEPWELDENSPKLLALDDSAEFNGNEKFGGLERFANGTIIIEYHNGYQNALFIPDDPPPPPILFKLIKTA